ncbi:LEAF RUST 10 DISEASE-RESISTANCEUS RECEPTOR-LIKE PROTEIN KINASE-like 2.5 [Typha angustifolia]|uniref:LEAF RUST 10 DISEASE-RESISTANCEUS RECEPTOR-LIKE PROTEIN KINASE-like 2.5 n=1 Tax=Typha angustifolia TaxID=59011 RepID=UPI003C2DCEFC
MVQRFLAVHSSTNRNTIQALDLPICLLLLCPLLSSVAGCSPSSCGHLHDIPYPFRLQTDPPECGSPLYQLICDDDKPYLELHSGKFFVKSISRKKWTINVVDLAFVSGNCSVPQVSLPLDVFGYIDAYDFSGSGRFVGFPSYFSNRVGFISCAKPIKDQQYSHIPCLSRNNNSVYAVVNPLNVGIVEPSCRFLAMTLIDSAADMSSTMDIFEHLQKGFILYYGMQSWSGRVQMCIRELSSEPSGKGILSSVSTFIFNVATFLSCPGLYYNTFPLFSILIDLTLLIALVRFVFAPLSIYIFLAYKFWSTCVSIDNVEKFLRNQQPLTPLRYSYTDLIAITGHFREKLGQGGFGSVFKATLLSGHHVAIKMLGNSKLNGEEFINEVSTVGRIHHINVVQLLGFCSEGSKRALVYEYMPKGSLDKYIFSAKGTSAHRPFTWEKLNNIALGVARGIDYLHRGCDMQILHFDIKPHNILLDHNFNPKVSDFGLAKLYPKDCSLVSLSAARGTIGYIAPELVSRSFGVISYKSDVYSFGMLLLEMVGGRRNVDPKMENSSQVYYPSWIYDQLNQGDGLMIDNSIEIHEVERKLCLIGLWCIQMKSANRPSMSKVVEMLEGDTNSIEMPARPFFSSSLPDSVRLSSMKSISEQLSIISEQEDLSNIEG